MRQVATRVSVGAPVPAGVAAMLRLNRHDQKQTPGAPAGKPDSVEPGFGSDPLRNYHSVVISNMADSDGAGVYTLRVGRRHDLNRHRQS
jgi:hypothetical protein